jgi:hypothetical protein
MLQFPSYNELLSEQAGTHNPFIGGLGLSLVVALAVFLLI